MVQQSYQDVLAALKKHIRKDKAAFFPGFFRAFPGGYGEGDQFLGVVVPDQRRVARQFSKLDLSVLAQLLASPWHECRLTALFILIGQFEQAKLRDNATDYRKQIVGFYLQNLEGVNNWDLVDAAAHKILGAYVLENPKQAKLLLKLAHSQRLWDQRIAVIATLPLIQHHDFSLTLKLAERFLEHPHDLMHKAVGWMLREIGNRNLDVLRGFLQRHSTKMPRTMLRYSIEKLPQSERQNWLAAKHK